MAMTPRGLPRQVTGSNFSNVLAIKQYIITSRRLRRQGGKQKENLEEDRRGDEFLMRERTVGRAGGESDRRQTKRRTDGQADRRTNGRADRRTKRDGEKREASHCDSLAVCQRVTDGWIRFLLPPRASSTRSPSARAFCPSFRVSFAPPPFPSGPHFLPPFPPRDSSSSWSNRLWKPHTQSVFERYKTLIYDFLKWWSRFFRSEGSRAPISEKYHSCFESLNKDAIIIPDIWDIDV